MKHYFPLIQDNPLFQDIAYSDFSGMLGCLSAQERCYGKKEIILLTGDCVDFVGMVLTGGVKIVKETIEGHQLLLTEVGPGELFGEVFACAEVFHSPVTIVANEDTRVLFFDYHKIITTCKNSCVFHEKLTKNMLKILAYKNLQLNEKIEILSKRSLREKLLCYFEHQGRGRKAFEISLNREELASYLCADRSALSNELSKMQKDGLIQYQKNSFQLLG